MGDKSIITNVPRRKGNKARVNELVIIIPVIIFLVVVLLINFGFFNKEENIIKDDVRVNLIGDSNLSLALNTSYTDMGFQVFVNDEKVSNDDISYRITDDIENGIVGSYKVNYEIMYDNQIYKLERNVNIIDDVAPELVVNNGIVEVFECKKKTDNNLDYSAVDNYDGIITDKVKKYETDNEIVLTVTDSSGNESSATIQKKFVSDPSKVIKINGKGLIYIPVNTKYKDDGAKAYNGCGKELKDVIKVTNNVDTSKSGTYYVVYNIYDGDNIITTKTRTVIVYDKVDSNKVNNKDEEKVIYLTFDDGPGRYTKELLNILKKHNVKATFFVTNQFKDYVPLIEDIHNDGHVVAVHTLTHKWSIYSSVETYMKDFNDMNDIIEKYTGKRSKIFRFPGGSSNTVSRGYSVGVVNAIASKMNSLGYVYFDWNVDSNDAAGANRDSIVKNTIDGIEKKDYSVVLMHDIKKNTIDAIEDIIIYAIDKGYKFDVLSEDAPTVHHGIRN